MRFSENMGTWGAWVPFATTYPYTLTSPNDGTKSVDVQFQDNAGNNSTMWAIFDYIILDTIKPTGTVLINNGSIATTSTSVYLNLTYTDTGSGISKIRFGNTGDPWSAWETPTPTKAWTIPSGDGTKNVWCQVIDNAGLISDQFYDGIILNTTNPTGSIAVNSGATTTTTTSVTLTLTYSDSGSGVTQVRYGNSGGSWSAWEAPSATKTWTLISGDGSKTVWYQVMDNAGLLSTMYSDTIVVKNPNAQCWYWTGNTVVNSVATGDVDGDGKIEVVSGGYYFDGTRKVAQLVVCDAASLSVERVKAWYWVGDTTINSIALGDVDGDGIVEIVTGCTYVDGGRLIAQLAVWAGNSLALDRITVWVTGGSNCALNSVAVGDVDTDGQIEIATGGHYFDGARNVAELKIWSGSTLVLEQNKPWYWVGNTTVTSVAVGNVDGDGQVEIVTGGYYYDGSRNIAQLIEWAGSGLAAERLTVWSWGTGNYLKSVAVGDVDADGQVEIVSGGYYFDGIRNVAQLMVWTGSSLSFGAYSVLVLVWQYCCKLGGFR